MTTKIYKVKDVEWKTNKKELYKDITNTIKAIDEYGEEVKYTGTFYRLKLSNGTVLGKGKLEKTKRTISVKKDLFKKKSVSELEETLFNVKSIDLPIKLTNGDKIRREDEEYITYKQIILQKLNKNNITISEYLMDAIFKPMETELLERFKHYLPHNY